MEMAGHSDTETLLAGFERWGVAATLAKTVGMFAIFVGRETAHTYLARDRFGKTIILVGQAVVLGMPLCLVQVEVFACLSGFLINMQRHWLST